MTDNTPASPDNQYGPVLLVLIPSVIANLDKIAEGSEDMKRIADNLGVAWMLPHFAYHATWLTMVGGLVWLWRRALSRNRPWALWLRDKLPRMPWERT